MKLERKKKSYVLSNYTNDTTHPSKQFCLASNLWKYIIYTTTTETGLENWKMCLVIHGVFFLISKKKSALNGLKLSVGIFYSWI